MCNLKYLRLMFQNSEISRIHAWGFWVLLVALFVLVPDRFGFFAILALATYYFGIPILYEQMQQKKRDEKKRQRDELRRERREYQEKRRKEKYAQR